MTRRDAAFRTTLGFALGISCYAALLYGLARPQFGSGRAA